MNAIDLTHEEQNAALRGVIKRLRVELSQITYETCLLRGENNALECRIKALCGANAKLQRTIEQMVGVDDE